MSRKFAETGNRESLCTFSVEFLNLIMKRKQNLSSNKSELNKVERTL